MQIGYIIGSTFFFADDFATSKSKIAVIQKVDISDQELRVLHSHVISHLRHKWPTSWQLVVGNQPNDFLTRSPKYISGHNSSDNTMVIERGADFETYAIYGAQAYNNVPQDAAFDVARFLALFYQATQDPSAKARLIQDYTPADSTLWLGFSQVDTFWDGVATLIESADPTDLFWEHYKLNDSYYDFY